MESYQNKIDNFNSSLLTLVLLLCSWFGTPDPNIYAQNNISIVANEGKNIYHKENKESCYTLDVYQFGVNFYSFDQAKEIRENGVFYHVDEVNERVISEKKTVDGNIEVKVCYWQENAQFEVLLISCSDKLKLNKVELHRLVQQFIST